MPHQPVIRPRAILAAVVAVFALSPSVLRGQDVAPLAPAAPSSLAPAIASPVASPAARTQDLSIPASVPAAPASGATKLGAPVAQAPVALARTVSRESPADALRLRRQEDSNRTNTTLMIIGAVAVLVGAAVEDDAGTILIVGGAGLGLWGLYRFLN